MARPVTALVGRRAELQRAREVVTAAFGGEPAALVVDGDAGVGKTRLLTELVHTAGPARLLIGHCVDLGDAPPPYLPLAEAFAALEPDVADALVADHPLVARLMPRGPRPGGDADQVDRGAMLDAVLGALTDLARQGPVLLVVEDLHWADIATRDLLGFVFTRLPALQDLPLAVLATVRSDDLHRRHPMRGTLAGWSRLPVVHRVHLDPLPPEAVGELVRHLDAGLDDDAVRDIVRRADGNAFFAEELLDSTRLGDDDLPWALADLLLVRLDPLGDTAQAVVRATAVAGRSLAHELLVELIDRPEGELEAALREAVEAHVLQAAPDAQGRPGYRFRHALLGEAVYDDLLPGERIRLHAAFAARLAKRPGAGAAELARHARAAGDLPVAYSAAVRAGAEAMAVGAPFEALTQFQTALELLGPRADGPEHAELVESLVMASIAAGRSRRGERIARDELSRLPADAAPTERATLLLAAANAAVAGEFDLQTVHDVVEAARLTADAPPSPLRARIAALQARVWAAQGRDTEAQRVAQDAIELAVAADNRASLVDAQVTLALLQRRLGDPELAVVALERAAVDAEAAGDHALEIRSRFQQALLLHDLGRLREAEVAAEAAWRQSAAEGRLWDPFAVSCRATVGKLRFARGDWDAALAGLVDDTGTAPPVSAAILESAALFVHAGRGEPDALDRARALRPEWEHEGRVGLYAAYNSVGLLGRAGRIDDAVAVADDLTATIGRLWMNEWFLARIELNGLVLQAVVDAVRTAPAAARDALVDTARRFVDAADETVRRGLPPGRTLGLEGRAWLARVHAAWASVRWIAGHEAPTADELVEAWRAAETATDYDDNVVELARVRAQLAGVLRAVGRRDEAVAVAGLARAVGRATGDVAVLEPLRALAVPEASSEDPAAPALTPRERDVLALVADGRTNRQIASRLFISEKTVSVHVSNILAKLGAGGRTEAAATARRQGLLD